MKQGLKDWLFIVLGCFVVVAGFSFCQLLHADSLYIGKKSHHFNPSRNITREQHTLIIYERNNWLYGYWKNSYDKHTLAFGKQKHLFEDKRDRLYAGVRGGIATGYPVPVFGSLYIDYEELSCDYLPTVLVACGLKYEF